AQALKNFGLSDTQAQTQAAAPKQSTTPDRIEASVVKVRVDANRRRVVTLDNGQVWLLTQSSHKGYIEPGDHILVRAAALSSFMLITKAGIPLRARRLR
ncbi:MAG: hypothetical protein L0H70_05570, partial [Xanthomonadales bacterium]|nr:hypothetical protein [Xanthomonadales bacterium]